MVGEVQDLLDSGATLTMIRLGILKNQFDSPNRENGIRLRGVYNRIVRADSFIDIDIY